MREYKFRGRRIDTGEWVYGNLIVTSDGHCIIQQWIRTEGIGYTHPNAGEVDPETVGQYTGLQDKNGKEIFEGDILKVPDLYELPENTSMTYHYEVISYENGAFTLGGQPIYEDPEYISEECEVVGTRWDNPELLGG